MKPARTTQFRARSPILAGWGLLCLAAWLAGLISVNGQDSENRFLFLVDVSERMERLAPQAQRAAQELILSGIGGRITNGDTLCVWSYNDKLHTDFKMQVWSETGRTNLSRLTVGYLQSKSSKNESRLDKALAQVFPLIQDSPFITVFWISDGTGTLRGTPFDQQINGAQADFGKDLREAGVPFVTVLAARGGQVIAYAVNSGIGPFEIPQAKPKSEPVSKPAVAVVTNPPAPVSPKPAREYRQITISADPKTNPPPLKPAFAPDIRTAVTNAAAPSPANLALDVGPAVASPAMPTNSSPVDGPPTNPLVAATSQPPPAAPTTLPPAPQGASVESVAPAQKTAALDTAASDVAIPKPAASHGGLAMLAAACGLFCLTLVIALALWHYLRKNRIRATLITESLERAGRSRK